MDYRWFRLGDRCRYLLSMRYSISTILLATTWAGIAIYGYVSSVQQRVQPSRVIHHGFVLEAAHGGKVMDFQLEWNRANPPISASRALAKANVIQFDLTKRRNDKVWFLDNIALIPLDTSGQKWCWCLSFVGVPDEQIDHAILKKRKSIAWSIDINYPNREYHQAYLLMDGTVVEPPVLEIDGPLMENNSKDSNGNGQF